ncbi:MAG: SpoIVB peptidase [Ruminococcaceae bacterium]|nr:SpoIVB peptidase [Oscillospiraceae bacterium]
MEKTASIMSKILLCMIASAAAVISCLYLMLPREISVEAGAECGGSFFGIDLMQTDDGIEYRYGSIPIKTVSATPCERPMLIPCGTPFGIKLRTSGVITVSVTENSPAEHSGIREGDVIISVNGEPVNSNSEISSAIQLCPEECEIILRRKNSERHVSLEPYSDCGIYKIGIWVRDSAAGLGTMTYCDPLTDTYGGLGHPVSDMTTGELMPLNSGEITTALITGAVKGESGTPGELCGTLLSEECIGTLQYNTECGIFGATSAIPEDAAAVPMAFRQEVHTGPATILATVDGCTPQEYDIEIQHINICDMESSKSMVIRITDPELIEKTGGIVCGMSGSPIIQDGRLAGAVTHVFLNDPTRGYAVFCETMLETQLSQ